MARIILISVLLFTGTSCFGQSDLSLVRLASKSLTLKDTSKAIQYLETFVKENPKSKLDLVLCQRLAEYYIQRKEYDSAHIKLFYAFKMIPTEKFRWEDIDSFSNLINFDQFNYVKANICVLLSTVYSLQNNNPAALKYLNLADTTYLPVGCANEMIMYRTYLSLKFADYYLRIGDTGKAINRLLDYFMLGERFSLEATQKLRKILHYRYSPAQINQEIDQGIAAAWTAPGTKADEPTQIFYFSIFGHTIRKRAYYANEVHQQRLRKNENLNMLRN